MERKTQRIVAVGVISVIVVASVIGVVVVMNLPTGTVNPYSYPGLDTKPSLSKTIKIGLLDDLATTGFHSEKGMILAATEINVGGGVDIDGETYYIGVVAEDTNEAYYNYEKGIAAALKMVGYDPDVVIGGFRTEVLSVYIDEIMDAHIPFIITGSATKAFCDNVGSAYSYWKYLFRVMPHNNERLGQNVGRQLSEIILPNISDYKFGGAPIDNVWIVYEDLQWTTAVKDSVVQTLNDSFPSYLGYDNITLKPLATSTDSTAMGALWDQIKASGTPIVVPILSDGTLGVLFGKYYGLKQPDAIVCGINVAAQDMGYMANTQGGGLYEITSGGSMRCNFTSDSIAFMDNYRAIAYGLDPLYTATGSYDAINLIKNRVEECDSLVAADLIASLEKVNLTNPWQGVTQKIAFDSQHDCIADTGSVATDGMRTNIYRQWQQNSTTGADAGVCPLTPSVNMDGNYFVNLRPSNETAWLLYPDWW